MNITTIPESTYIHGNEVNQFIHIQVPMDLVVADCFSNLSGDAKILYGLLLNRTGLSIRNGWEDDKGRTYIYYTIKDVMADMHITHSKASRLFSELTNIVVIGKDEDEKDIYFGLVEKVRCLNKPSRIYVHKVDEVRQFIENIASVQDCSDAYAEEKTFTQIGQRVDEEVSEAAKIQVVSKIGRRSSQKQDDGHPIDRTTVISRIGQPSSQKQDENNKYINNNNLSNNNSNQSFADESNLQDDVMERMDITRALIKDNIEYQNILIETRHSQKKIDELIEIMVEACVLMGDVEISGTRIPHQLIQSRFEKYDKYTMIAVLDSLSANTTDVRNVKKYLLATLFNAPITMSNQIDLAVMHNLYS